MGYNGVMDTLQKTALFWDIDRQSLDVEQHKRFIIERILARGDTDDFLFAERTYGSDAIRETLLKAKTLDRKSLSFWCFYFNIDKRRCTEKLSLLKRAAFWKK